jgi:plasmid stability protein
MRQYLIAALFFGTLSRAFPQDVTRENSYVKPGENIVLENIPPISTSIANCRDVSRLDMCSTCNYADGMARMIQVRNVPDALHRSLKGRAAMAGMSLSDYLLRELQEIAERPTLAEFRERLHTRKPVRIALDTAGLVHEERAAR